MKKTFKLHPEAAPDIYKTFGRTPFAGRRSGNAPAPTLTRPQSTIKGMEGKNWPAWTVKNLRMITEFAWESLKDYDQFSTEVDIKDKAILVVGEAGIGKSSIFKTVSKHIAAREGLNYVEFNKLNRAQKMKYIGVDYGKEGDVEKELDKSFIYIDIRTTEILPDTLAGIPDVPLAQKQGYLVSMLHAWVVTILNPHFKGMIIVDEYNRQRDESVQAQLMKFVLDRQIGNDSLSRRCLIVAAANMGSKFQLFELDDAQIRRFRDGVLVVEPEEWAEYARDVGIHKDMIDYAMSNPDENLFGRTGNDVITGNIPINPASLEFASNTVKKLEKMYRNAKEQGYEITDKYPNMTGNIYEDIRPFITADLSDKWGDGFLEYLQIIHKFDWEEFAKLGKQGSLKGMMSSQIGNKGANELTTSEKYAITNWASNEIVTRYIAAREDKDVKKKEELIEKIFYVLYSLDKDNTASILKSVKNRIADRPFGDNVIVTVDQQKAAIESWRDLMMGFSKKAKETDPKYFEEIQNLTKDMKDLQKK